jgi:hypothetical protein
MYNTANFFELKGQTIIDIDRSDASFIKTATGEYQLYHNQDCCESVTCERVVGNVGDILNSPITLAEDDHNEPDWHENGNTDTWIYDSHTWSRFALETVKGRVEFWFLGVSNGYYSETMTFEKVN